MSFGMQTFIKGTSFDVLNSMDFNYVLDVFYVNPGSGSRTYTNFPGGSLQMFTMLAGTSNEGARTFSYSQNGKTISWSINHQAQVAIIAIPAVNAQPVGEVGFSCYKNGRLQLAPNFTPLVLNQVLDIGTGLVTVQTNVPYGQKFVAFHRTRGQDGFLDEVLWDEINQNGYYTLRFKIAKNRYPVRIYVFSDRMVNIPNYGFFVYRGGQIVYHGNCLPLNIKVYDTTGSGVLSSTPLAVSNGLARFASAVVGNAVISILFANGAGWSSSDGRWKAGVVQIDQQQGGGGGPTPQPSWSNRYFAYIDTDIYDRYYRQSLGV